MLVPRHQNLDCIKGQPFDAAFQLWRDDAKTQPVDLTGITINVTLGDSTFTDAPDVVAVPAADGSSGDVPNEVQVALTGTQTGSFDPPYMPWYLELVGVGVPLSGLCNVTDPAAG